MQSLSGVDWKAMLVPDTPLLEIALRGTMVYLSLFLLLRFLSVITTDGSTDGSSQERSLPL